MPCSFDLTGIVTTTRKNTHEIAPVRELALQKFTL